MSYQNLEEYLVKSSVLNNGGLWLWGYNGYGTLGDNTITHKSSPVQTIAGGTNWKQTVGGTGFSVGIKTDGTLWLWGQNSYGQLGDNTITHKSSPVQTIAGGTNWKQVSISGSSVAAIKTDGTLWTWGYNGYGQLGYGSGDLNHKSSPVQTIAGGTNWKQVSIGATGASGIKTDGTLWIWGTGGYGALGNNTVVDAYSPIQTISGGTNWKQVAYGGWFAAAIKTDGTLWSWGLNTKGQLGDNTVVHKSSPVQTIAGGTNWKQVSCSINIIAAVKTDGTLWLWGSNSNGELGNNNILDSKSSPIQTIAGGTNWKQVSAVGSTYAIKTDGTLWAWGYNGDGQLGDGTSIDRLSPVQTIAGGTNWKYVSGSTAINDTWGKVT